MEPNYLYKNFCCNHNGPLKQYREANVQLKRPTAYGKSDLAYGKTRKPFALVLLIVLCIILFISVVVLVIWLLPQRCDCVSSMHDDILCPEDWIMYRGKCYYFSEAEANWFSSQTFCSFHNASLAKIENEEKDFIMRLKGKDSFWIGLTRDPNQHWKWTNGKNATLDVLGNGGPCAYLNNEPKATASSSRCSSEFRWICSKSKAPNRTLKG